MSQAPSNREQFERVMLLLRRSATFWKRGLIVFLVLAMIAVPFVFTRPRSYRSETVMLYHETIQPGEGGGETSSDSVRRVGARLREVLLSRGNLEPIITDLGLYPDQIIRGELIGAVEEMRKHITFRGRDGDTFEISFTDPSPERAQEVTKRLGECITQEAARRRNERAKTLKDFLQEESRRNETDLKAKEAELAKFVVLHPQFAPQLQGLPPTQTAPNAPPPTLGVTSSGYDAKLASLEARAAGIDRQLKAGVRPDAPPPPKPPSFQPPPESAELVAARQDYNDKSMRFTEKHPDVIAAKNRLKAAEQAHAATVEQAQALFAKQHPTISDPPPPKNETDEAALKKELSELQGQIAARRAALAASRVQTDGGATVAAPLPQSAGSVELELEFRRLFREVNEGRDRQHQLDAKLFTASMTESSAANDRNIQVSVLDPAYLPVRPVSKSRTLMLAALLALALVLGIATMVVSASFDDHIYERVDIERLDIIIPVVGVIPRARELPPGPRPDT